MTMRARVNVPAERRLSMLSPPLTERTWLFLLLHFLQALQEDLRDRLALPRRRIALGQPVLHLDLVSAHRAFLRFGLRGIEEGEELLRAHEVQPGSFLLGNLRLDRLPDFAERTAMQGEENHFIEAGGEALLDVRSLMLGARRDGDLAGQSMPFAAQGHVHLAATGDGLLHRRAVALGF